MMPHFNKLRPTEWIKTLKMGPWGDKKFEKRDLEQTKKFEKRDLKVSDPPPRHPLKKVTPRGKDKKLPAKSDRLSFSGT